MSRTAQEPLGGSLASCINRIVSELGARGSRQAAVPMQFIEFVNRVNPRYRWSRHNLKLAEVLQRVADGELTRIMVFMPPRHGKSELVSRLFSAYYLFRHPALWVGLASYGANLAYSLSRVARVNFMEAGGALDPAARSVTHWETSAGGGLWAAGIGGAMTGKGWNLGIIDDPIKNAEAALSEAVREKHKEWYRSTFTTRAMPPESLIVVQTLWNPDDLSGWLLAEEEAEVVAGDDGLPEHWHIVYFPAILPAQEERRTFPQSCSVETDERVTGEALWPDRFPLKRLERIRHNSQDWWESLYQQNPVPTDGLVLNPAWFPIVRPDQVPTVHLRGMGVDLAVAAKESSDWTVALPIARGTDGRFYLFRPYRARAEAPDAEEEIAVLARRELVQVVGVESVAFQLSFVQYMRRRRDMIGIPIVPVSVDTDKVARARGTIAPLARHGQIVLVEDGTGWTAVFLNEVKTFPKVKKDQVDALGVALLTMAQAGAMPMAPLVGGAVNDPFKPR